MRSTGFTKTKVMVMAGRVVDSCESLMRISEMGFGILQSSSSRFFRWGLRYCGVVAVDCTHLTVTSQTRTGNSYQLGQTLLLVSHTNDNNQMDIWIMTGSMS